MIKTTLPSEGSRLLRVREDNPACDARARSGELDGGAVRLMVTGMFWVRAPRTAAYDLRAGYAARAR